MQCRIACKCAYSTNIYGWWLKYTVINNISVKVAQQSSSSISSSVVIPSTVTNGGNVYNVTAVGDWAFSYCRGLTSVTIGSNVASIGNQVFSGCSDLISLVSLATIPPIIGNEFFPSPNICDVTIPCCSLGIYTTSSWNDYFNGRFTEGLSFDLSVSANDEAYGRVEVETQSCNVRTLLQHRITVTSSPAGMTEIQKIQER